MTALLLTIHFIVAVSMVGTILLQRSEGGALGLGGGGGVSSLMSGRGAANALSRTTVILAGIFLATSLALAMIAKANSHGTSVVAPTGAPAAPGLPAIPRPLGPATTPSPLTPAVPVPATPSPSAPAGAPPSNTAPAPSTTAPSTPAPSSAPATPPPAPASGGGH